MLVVGVFFNLPPSLLPKPLLRGDEFVSLSVCHKPVFCRNGLTDQAAFRQSGYLQVILHCVLREFGYHKNKGTSPFISIRT